MLFQITTIIRVYSAVLLIGFGVANELLLIDGIKPEEIYRGHPETVATLTQELAAIRKACEKKISGEPIHSATFIEQVRALIQEDWRLESIDLAKLENATTLDQMLQPHTFIDALKYLSYDQKTRYYVFKPTSDEFESLYICTQSGILCELTILAAAACGFWVYGVPTKSDPYYEADRKKFLSRLGFINHDSFHRNFIGRNNAIFNQMLYGKNLLTAAPSIVERLRNLLSISLTPVNINFFFNILHESTTKSLGAEIEKKDFFHAPSAYELYTHYFCIKVSPLYFTEDMPIFPQLLRSEPNSKTGSACPFLEKDIVKILGGVNSNRIFKAAVIAGKWGDINAPVSKCGSSPLICVAKEFFSIVLSLGSNASQIFLGVHKSMLLGLFRCSDHDKPKVSRGKYLIQEMKRLLSNKADITAFCEYGFSLLSMICLSGEFWIYDHFKEYFTKEAINTPDKNGILPIFYTLSHRFYNDKAYFHLIDMIAKGANISFMVNGGEEEEPFYMRYFDVRFRIYELVKAVALNLKQSTLHSDFKFIPQAIHSFMRWHSQDFKTENGKYWSNWTLDDLIKCIDTLIERENLLRKSIRPHDDE